MTETSNAAFPKSIRLLNAKDYSDVFSSVDIKLSTQYFLCLSRKSSHADHARLGIIAAKKHIRFAVNRNRVKRVLRESFRLHQHKLPSYDIVMLTKQGCSEAENEKLNKELQYIWRKLKQKAKS